MSDLSVSTTKCSAHNHQEFILLFDSSIPEIDVARLVCFLEETVEQGEKYKSGELVAIGSMLFRVADFGGVLSLQEPDMESIPIAWTMGVTKSMRLFRLQRDVAYSVGLLDEIDQPSLRSSLLIGSDVTQQGAAIVLERADTNESDSGWFVGLNNTSLNYNDEASLNRISVYQAILNWPQIAGFLGLPAGCRVDVSVGSSRFSRNGKSIEIVKGSLLDIIGSA